MARPTMSSEKALDLSWLRRRILIGSPLAAVLACEGGTAAGDGTTAATEDETSITSSSTATTDMGGTTSATVSSESVETSAAATSTSSSASSDTGSSGSSTNGTTAVSASTSVGSESTTGENGTPPPAGRRWVLRDVDGVASNAVVEPVCRSGLSECTLPDIGHVGAIAPQCVRVIWFNGQYVDLKYDAQTGRAEDCDPLGPTPTFPGAYPTPDCAPPGYDSPGAGTDEAFRWTRRIHTLEDDTVLYESNDAPKQDLAMAYGWSGGCVANPLLIGFGLSPWLEIPQWAANALPNPPYTLSWE